MGLKWDKSLGARTGGWTHGPPTHHPSSLPGATTPNPPTLTQVLLQLSSPPYLLDAPPPPPHPETQVLLQQRQEELVTDIAAFQQQWDRLRQARDRDAEYRLMERQLLV